MNQYNPEWSGPRDAYRSLEGALGAAVRLSAATGASAFVLENDAGDFCVTGDPETARAKELLGAAVACVVALTKAVGSRKPKSNSPPPPLSRRAGSHGAKGVSVGGTWR